MDGEQLAERDVQRHEAQHPGCNERYWRERCLQAEAAADHFFRCRQCSEMALCPDGLNYATMLKLVA